MAVAVTAPIIGKVLQVRCRVGDCVAAHQELLVMESMKMEIPVPAPAAGVVKELKVIPGQAVESDTVLAILE
jgi:biotin carboxyl carrier protein